MIKVKYKGGHLPLREGQIYNVSIQYDDDCDYVRMVNYSACMTCIYDGREEMEKEWEIIK